MGEEEQRELLERDPGGEGGRNGGARADSEPTGTSRGDHVAVPIINASVARTEGLAELEIRSLLWIEQAGNEVYAKAYKEWEKKDLLFARRIDKKKNQSSSLRNEIYQLIGFYSVFQGVLLTAVAQSNLLKCYNWWSAFSLSLFASVVTIAGVMQKFWASLALEKTIQNEADTRQECISRARRLLQMRGDFDFNEHAADGRKRQFPQTKLLWPIAVVAAVLLIFSALFLVSIFRVLCRTERHSPAPSPA